MGVGVGAEGHQEVWKILRPLTSLFGLGALASGLVVSTSEESCFRV